MIKTIKRQRQSDWMKEQDQTSWRNTLQRSKRMQWIYLHALTWTYAHGSLVSIGVSCRVVSNSL